VYIPHFLFIKKCPQIPLRALFLHFFTLFLESSISCVFDQWHQIKHAIFRDSNRVFWYNLCDKPDPLFGVVLCGPAVYGDHGPSTTPVNYF